MSQIRVCFLGTPEFAVTSLKALLEDEHFEVVGVVTQPDRPAGRKLSLTPSPVKVLAQNNGLKVLAPESLKDNRLILDAIKTWGAEIAVVVAFGQILSEEFMSSFSLGAVNVHASLLPRWRGAAPIQRAIQYGDLETGVALQKMVKKLDAGDIIGIRKTTIPTEMTALELQDQLAFLGADLLRVDLMDYIRGNLAPVKQNEENVLLAKKIDKLESEIKWSLSALEIHNQVRALTMGPGSYTFFEGKKIKIHKTLWSKESSPRSMKFSTQADLNSYLSGYKKRQVLAADQNQIGRILKITEEALTIQCGPDPFLSGAGSKEFTELEVIEVQPESRNKMKIKDFLQGHSLKIGDKLGAVL
ncbi:MAG: methionyl-tRNA formyltransferase [Deltaproteobacteria bacterium]|jgi:methionyl-tRNA formyltransferase|nr:methionyl-tRNA formyltransferase [Deltaproteobacteria bacterium]